MAANVPGSLAVAARPVLGRKHGRYPMDRYSRPLSPAGRPGGFPGRILRPDVGDAGRAGYLPRLRAAGGLPARAALVPRIPGRRSRAPGTDLASFLHTAWRLLCYQ